LTYGNIESQEELAAMDYVDWVEKVFRGVNESWERGGEFEEYHEHNKDIGGVSAHLIAQVMGFDRADMTNGDPAKPTLALYSALSDLTSLGLLKERKGGIYHYQFTQFGRQLLESGLHLLWPSMAAQYVSDKQGEVLSKLVELCQDDRGTHVNLVDRSAEEVFAALDPSSQVQDAREIEHLVEQLETTGLARDRISGLTPTYQGIVRVTRRDLSYFQQLIGELVEEWENTNVDFKQELNLSKNKEKADFVKDALALATTKSPGKRYMVIGFHDKTRAFHHSVDPTITANQLENILDAYTAPVPSIRYIRVPWENGTVGVIEITREPHKLPYKVKKDVPDSKVKAGLIYVRHNSHTVTLNSPVADLTAAEELQRLIDEGDRARSQ
jgi:hypothetical protein